ncbi:MAG: hypothetical protein IJR74_03350 [Paludibacteraceae bacterium]|nr:hypothetical protein [Paludibacteraceae bacterium]
MNATNRKIVSSVITLVVMVLLFLLLWFVYIGVPVIEEEEGIEVAFGVVPQAGGHEARESQAVPLEQAPAPPAKSEPAPSQSEVMTQEDEEALAIARQREEEIKKQQELEAAEQAEKARQEAEARAKAEAEAKAQAERLAREQAAIANANAFGSLFGNNGSQAQGSGDTKGAGQKGNPVGQGSIGGNQWSLAGRSVKSMPKPNNDFKQDGRVVVQIIVDANGKVVSAQAIDKGTTISDDYTRQLAVKAALKAEFSFTDRPDKQIGTITYYFQFK